MKLDKFHTIISETPEDVKAKICSYMDNLESKPLRIQIIHYDKWLKEYWGVYLWSIHMVIEKKEYLTGNKRSKHRETIVKYWINAVRQSGNNKGRIDKIVIYGHECKEVE